MLLCALCLKEGTKTQAGMQSHNLVCRCGNNWPLEVVGKSPDNTVMAKCTACEQPYTGIKFGISPMISAGQDVSPEGFLQDIMTCTRHQAYRIKVPKTQRFHCPNCKFTSETPIKGSPSNNEIQGWGKDQKAEEIIRSVRGF